ncbi:hypothetical protein C9374_004179 [Naegleria lovaniensis]|uniref:Uncharacterized protein n=1 Tax=Naegleria lovaniensis TaxID=51637 RepID=A0AA88KKV6_NAELO|nr:uncharacterized protein C9374_004179 [Naegleria lovaniensis]KAG2383508.1 hypothetical protein C9374_004179 [Naegleria lovaniensis]
MDTSSTPIKSEAQAKIEGNPLASSSHPAEQLPKTSLNNDQGFSILEGLALVVVESTVGHNRIFFFTS